MPSSPSTRTRLCLILCAALFVAAYALLNHVLVSETLRVLSAGSWRQAFNQCLVFGVSMGLFALLLTTAGRWMRTLWLAGFAVSSLVNLVYQRITSNRINFDSSVWLVEEVGQIGNVVRSYSVDVLVATAWVAGGILLGALAARIGHQALAGWPRNRVRALGFATFAVMLGWNVLLLSIVSPRHPLESSMLTYAAAGQLLPEPVSGEVTLPASSAPFDKIVLVVDESIRHDHFASMLGDETRRRGAIDFGEAIAFAPCSAASNALLRWGFSMDMLPPDNRDPREHPRIWRYAQRAGLRSHLLDGQTTGAPQNFMSRGERTEIGDFSAMQAGMETDKGLAAKLNAILKTDSRDFVYAIKMGAHFAYQYNYPIAWRSATRTRAQRYDAAIKYSTSGFFDSMLDGVDLARVLIVYTSDHGQRLDGSGASHCNPAPKRGEYSVPLLAFTGNAAWRDELRQAAGKRHAAASHLQIFPTLLAAMGYDRRSVASAYYPTLFDEPGASIVIGYPFKPFPNFRNKTLPIRRIDSLADIGPADDGNDPAD